MKNNRFAATLDASGSRRDRAIQQRLEGKAAPDGREDRIGYDTGIYLQVSRAIAVFPVGSVRTDQSRVFVLESPR